MVPCLASPAAAEISTSDLTGTWLVRGLVAGASVDNNAASATGSVTFDATGTVTAGSLLTALNEPFPMAPGSLVVSAEGRLTGTLGVGTDDSAFQGRLVRDGAQGATRIVGTLTRGFGTPASRSMFVVMSKTTAGATFAQDPDGTGMWRVKSLLLPERPLHVPDVIDGVIVVEPDGTISGGRLTSIVNEIDLSEFTGALTLDTAGNFSGTLSIPAFAETSTFSGRMSPDKSLMLGAIERQLSDARQLGLFEMARLPGADAPSPRQLQPGTWELVSLQVQAEQGTVGESLVGTIELGPGGAITGGALIGLDGQVDTIVEGSYSTAASGEALVQVFTEARTLTIFGTLLPSVNQVFGYDVLDTDRAPDAYGFVNLVRVDPVSAPAASTVQFQAASTAQRVVEGSTATLRVDRSGATSTLVSVQYRVTGGSASGGSNYDLPGTGTLSFQPGEVTKSFTVVTRPDGALEGDETVTLELVNPTGGAVLGSRATALVTIADNALVQFQQATFTVAENAGKAVITAVRSGAAGIAFSVPYSATALSAVDKIDFHTVSGTLTFGAGVPSRTFTVPILNDTALDGNRSVRVTLGPPTNGVQLGSPATASLVIQDDDTPGAFKLDAGKYTVLESARVLPVKVLRTGPNLAGNVTVFFRTVAGTAVDGVNYAGVATPLTFGSGQTSRLVNIPILRDFVVAPSPRTLSVELSAPGSGATLAAPSTAPVTITEVDLGGQIKFASAKYSVPEGGTSVTLTVVRTGGAAGGVSVDFVTHDRTALSGDEGDFVLRTGTITFAGGSASATVTIPIRQDTLAEGLESFTVELRNPRGGATLPVPPAPGRVATVTIVDDEPLVQFSGRFMGNSPEVVRTGQMGSRVTVNYEAISETATSGVDFMPMVGTLTFGPNVRSQLIPLVIVRDIIAEGSETFTIRLSDPQPVGGLQLGPAAAKTFTIVDDEFGGTNLRFEAPAYSGDEGQTVTLTVRRDGGLGTMLAVSWKALGGNALAGVDFSPAEGTVMFDPAASAATFQITLANDTLVEGTEFALLALSVPAGAAALGPQATTTLTIGDRTPSAPIQFESATYSALETAGVATISLVRAGNLDQLATVQYATTEGGTATPGVDYTPVTGTVTFPAGAARVHFDVPVLRDALVEGPETISLALGATSAGSTLGARATAVLTIVDGPAYTFAEIATTGVDGFRSLALPVINDAGVVAYAGTLADGTMEIHTSDDSIVLATDESATIVPELALNNAGHLAFGGTLADGRRGVFRVSPTLMSIVALTGFASGEFRTFGSPSLNNRGDLVFSADVIGGSEVLVRTTGDQLVTVADAGGNTFASFPPRPAINDAGVILFPTFLRSEELAVFKADDTLTPLADVTRFDGEFQVRPGSLNAAGRTAFIGLGLGASGEQRVMTHDALNQLQTTVTTASGIYTSLSNGDNSPALNDAGMVAFWAGLGAGMSGIFTGPNPAASTVIRTGEALFGATVVEIELGGLNNRGEIAFRAVLSSGRQVIGVATPPGLCTHGGC
jgi:hypothetical protein